jgi:hypothetical protein
VAILALGFAGYTVLNPHVTTVTEQQLFTITLSVYSTQTQTVTSVSQVTQVVTVTNTQPVAGSGLKGYYNGAYYGYWNGNFYPPCQTSGYGNTVACSGYLFQAQNGCTVLVIPIANPGWYSGSFVYQYYTLRNLPSNIPANGSWVTISGQLYQEANTSSTGASCPGNYINVTSIS